MLKNLSIRYYLLVFKNIQLKFTINLHTYITALKNNYLTAHVMARIPVPDITRLMLLLVKPWSVVLSPSVRKVFCAEKGGFGVWPSDNFTLLLVWPRG